MRLKPDMFSSERFRRVYRVYDEREVDVDAFLPVPWRCRSMRMRMYFLECSSSAWPDVLLLMIRFPCPYQCPIIGCLNPRPAPARKQLMISQHVEVQSSVEESWPLSFGLPGDDVGNGLLDPPH